MVVKRVMPETIRIASSPGFNETGISAVWSALIVMWVTVVVSPLVMSVRR